MSRLTIWIISQHCSSAASAVLCVPPGLGRAALDFGLAAGLSVSGLYGPLKQWRERQLSSIFASGQTLRLQFPKEDLGFVYNTPGAAICPETGTTPSASHRPSAQPQPDSAGADATAVNTKGRVQKATRGSVGGSDRRYRPSCTPGSRLPHCTLRQLNTGSLPCSGLAQLQVWSVLLQTGQLCSTIPAEDVACFCCCFVQHVCSAAMLPCLSGVCILLAFCLVVIDVIFLLADFFQRWIAVFDVHIMVNCCYVLHHLPICSPFAMHMHLVPPCSHADINLFGMVNWVHFMLLCGKCCYMTMTLLAPGSRLLGEHVLAPIADGSLSGAEMSTLDLVSADKWRLLLLIRSGPLIDAWLEAASTLVRPHDPLSLL